MIKNHVGTSEHNWTEHTLLDDQTPFPALGGDGIHSFKQNHELIFVVCI